MFIANVSTFMMASKMAYCSRSLRDFMSSFIKASAMVLLQTFVTTTKKCIQLWNCINLSFIPTEILADIYSVKMHLILKALSEIPADDILFYFLLF